MDNLFTELEECLEDNGYKLADIYFVYGNDYQITLDNFIEVAKKTKYDGGYGGQEVASDLCIRGKGFLIIRGEYDGSEWFEFISLKVPEEIVKITKLTDPNESWVTMKELNKGETNEI